MLFHKKEGAMKSKKESSESSKTRAMLLQTSDPASVEWEMQQIQLAVARRAYELFERRDREHGHDWEDWFQSETEMLRPISMAMSETAERYSIRANVLGFAASDLKVSVEPFRVLVVGRIEGAAPEAEGAAAAVAFPDQTFRVIQLNAEIDPKSAVVELDAGVLKVELLKAAKSQAQGATAGKA
jgi:HSP20 family molecular chaperone IbpA